MSFFTFLYFLLIILQSGSFSSIFFLSIFVYFLSCILHFFVHVLFCIFHFLCMKYSLFCKPHLDPKKYRVKVYVMKLILLIAHILNLVSDGTLQLQTIINTKHVDIYVFIHDNHNHDTCTCTIVLKGGNGHLMRVFKG